VESLTCFRPAELLTLCWCPGTSQAYRRLALQLHPDKNSVAEAAEAFKVVSHAYNLLSQPAKVRSQIVQAPRLGPRQGPFICFTLASPRLLLSPSQRKFYDSTGFADQYSANAAALKRREQAAQQPPGDEFNPEEIFSKFFGCVSATLFLYWCFESYSWGEAANQPSFLSTILGLRGPACLLPRPRSRSGGNDWSARPNWLMRTIG
jgi:hypothetical protein